MPSHPNNHWPDLVQTSPPLTSSVQSRLDNLIVRHWLTLGYLVLLTGLFWVTDGSLFTKLYYGLVAAPALLALIIAPHNLRSILREPMVLAFLAFSGWLLFSLFWTRADDGLGGLAKRPLYIFMMFASCALIACKDEQLLLKVLRISAILATLAALINLYLYFATPSAEGRLIGTGALRNPLLTSHVLGFFCTYWIAAWLTRSERHDWLPILLTLPLLAALLATGSRTPLLALTLTSVWMLAMSGRRSLYLVAALVVAAGVSLVLMPELLLQRGLSFRPQLWSEAISQAGDHLWIGHGYNSKFIFAVEGLNRTLSDPHNVELAVLLELGLAGLGLWLLMYGLALQRCWQHKHQAKFQLASALIVYGLSAGLTEGSNFFSRPNENWFLIWIPLSLVAALSIHQRLQYKP
jgi:O-antigen ligase